MELTDAEQLALIAGSLAFLLVCLTLIVCKLSPHCWLHNHCLKKSKHGQEYKISSDAAKAKCYESTGNRQQSTLTHPQVNRWRQTTNDSSDGDECYHIEIEGTADASTVRSSRISTNHYGSSSDSPLSDSGPDLERPCLVKGQISFSVFYPEDEPQHLHVWIQKVNNLIIRRRDRVKLCVKVQLMRKESNIDRFLKFFQFLDPEQQEGNVEYETQTSLKPIHKPLEWTEHRRLPVPKDEIQDRCIRLMCCLHDQFSHYIPIGQVVISLNDINLSEQSNLTKSLMPVRPESRGEILISLSYLPTAEKLVVLLAECKQLKLIETKYPSTVYIRISLASRGSYIKFKTPAKDAQPRMSWNEPITFDVPQDQLNDVNIVITVRQSLTLADRSKDIVIGNVVLGAHNCPLKGQQQWNAMLLSPRQPQSEWYTLI